MTPRTLAKLTGISYLIIFFSAIYANFFVLEALLNDPLGTIEQQGTAVRLGIVAFLLTVIFDVVVAWALYELYKNHTLTRLSIYFRMMHAAIMGVAIFALPLALNATTVDAVLGHIEVFNTIWFIGLFFFGIHLILLGKILQQPKLIAFVLIIAGLMYMVDTVAHFVLSNYDSYADIFLAMVAIPSVLGEMSLAIWLLVKGGKYTQNS